MVYIVTAFCTMKLAWCILDLQTVDQVSDIVSVAEEMSRLVFVDAPQDLMSTLLAGPFGQGGSTKQVSPDGNDFLQAKLFWLVSMEASMLHSALDSNCLRRCARWPLFRARQRSGSTSR